MRTATGIGVCILIVLILPTAAQEPDRMAGFGFLLGDWNLVYDIPQSEISQAMTGTGMGTFKRDLNHYVFFDYTARIMGSESAAHAVFTRDSKIGMYRYWWFEDSGQFMTAVCRFVNDSTLYMNWHNSLLSQTFTRVHADSVRLDMQRPDAAGKPERLMTVMLIRRQPGNENTH